MSDTNYGNQTVTFRYQNPTGAHDFNSYWTDIFPPGIYSGGNLTIVSGNTINISAFVGLFKTSSGALVKVETAANVELTIAEATPYIVGNYTWVASSTNYLDFYARDYSSLYNNDVIFGEGIYSGGVLTGFDLTARNYGVFNEDGDVIVANDLIVSGKISNVMTGNVRVLTTDVNVDNDTNYFSVSPLTINDGVTITLDDEASWFIT